MAEKLTFKYDAVGDILYINKCSPYAEQESQELDYGIIARLNRETEEIENIEPVSISKIIEKVQLSPDDLCNALLSLGNRALIEKEAQDNQALFSLSPVVRQYVISYPVN